MQQMQLVTYTGAIPVTSSTVFRLWTGRGTDRWLTTSMNGPGDKTNIYQAFVKAKTTQQVVRDKQTISHLRLGLSRLSRLRRCFRNGGILCHSGFCRRRLRHHRSSARATLIASTRLHRFVSECSYLGCTVDTPTHFSPLPSSPP